MRRAAVVLVVAGLVVGSGVASAYPAAPRAKTSVAVVHHQPASQSDAASPAGPDQDQGEGFCLNLDRDHRYACTLGKHPPEQRCHTKVEVPGVIAYWSCQKRFAPPAEMCVNLDRDRRYLCILGGKPDLRCRLILGIPQLVAFYSCGPGGGLLPGRRL